MSWYARFRNVFRPEDLNTELDHEREFHIAETVDALVGGGMSGKDAGRDGIDYGVFVHGRRSVRHGP